MQRLWRQLCRVRGHHWQVHGHHLQETITVYRCDRCGVVEWRW